MSKLPMHLKRRGSRLVNGLGLIPLEMGLNPLMRARRFDACCCGLSKTGTHSMAGVFGRYRSRHHPDAGLRLALSIHHLNGELSAVHAERALRKRDRKLWLEMESSTLAGILIEALVKACPEKKFILTLRDVYSWCDSWIDQNLNHPLDPHTGFAKLDRVRLRSESFAPTKHDLPLVERGFPSLASFFQLWTGHNMRVLAQVPPERLLVVKTNEIVERLPEIARWVGIGPEMLRLDQAWLAAAPKKHGVLAMLDASYVRDTAEWCCGPLMDRYFSEVRTGSA